MGAKLAGHALQLLGYALVFLGLGVVVAALFVSGNYPVVPLWVFLAVAVAVGAPLMIAGGRIDSRGRGRVLGQSPEQAARHYREQTVLMAFYLGFLWLHGALVVAPLFLRATGLAHPGDEFIKIWLFASTLTLCAGRPWITRPLWHAIEQRVLARGDTQGTAGPPRRTWIQHNPSIPGQPSPKAPPESACRDPEN